MPSTNNASPVFFAVANPAAPDAGPVVYISSDPSLGKLLITIQNNSGAPLTLAPSATLSISMFPLLLPADIKNIKVAGTAWTLTSSDKTLELSPKATLHLSSQIQIELDNVFSSQKTGGAGYFIFAYSGFGSAGAIQANSASRFSGNGSVRVNMQRLKRNSLQANVNVDFSTRPNYDGDSRDVVYQTTWTPPDGKTGVANFLLPFITNNGATALPLGDSPKIVISFLSGNDSNCLCTDQQLGALAVSVVQSDPDCTWTVTLDTSDAAPMWTITPDAGNPFFLGASGGTLALKFDNLVTFLGGVATPMFVTYSGLGSDSDGSYSDGYQLKMLTKGPPVPASITYTAADANGNQVNNNASVIYNQPLTLSWDVFAAESCSLNGQTLPPTGTSVVHPLDPATAYSLEPFVGRQPFAVVQLQFAILPPTAQLSIQGGALSWVCTGGDQVILTANGVALQGNQPLSGSLGVSPDVTTQYQIICSQLHGPKGSASSALIDVVPPAILSFKAIIYGTQWTWGWTWSMDLEWSTSGGADCTITILSGGYPRSYPPGTMLARGLSGSSMSQFGGVGDDFHDRMAATIFQLAVVSAQGVRKTAQLAPNIAS